MTGLFGDLSSLNKFSLIQLNVNFTQVLKNHFKNNVYADVSQYKYFLKKITDSQAYQNLMR